MEDLFDKYKEKNGHFKGKIDDLELFGKKIDGGWHLVLRHKGKKFSYISRYSRTQEDLFEGACKGYRGDIKGTGFKKLRDFVGVKTISELREQ